MSAPLTLDNVRHIIPEAVTPSQESAINAYLAQGTIPSADPCISCEPNVIRKYISRLQKAERDGTLVEKKSVELKNEFVPAQEPKDLDEVAPPALKPRKKAAVK